VTRQAVRGVIVDEDDHVLLVRVTPRPNDSFWLCPGGGIEPEEPDDAALARELAEEVGLKDFERGPLLWTVETEHGNVHRFYLVRCPRFDPATGPGQPEDEVFDEYRWWAPAELAASGVLVWPPDLCQRLAPAGGL
jgi:8-oxo-dGTP diphosphatase